MPEAAARAAANVEILLEALPYIRVFRDKLFVIKLGGELLREPDHLDAIARDLTLCSMVGVRVIVVHGGGPQANEVSEQLGFKPQMVEGRRVTDASALEVAKMVFAGKINTEMLSALSRHGGRGVGISGVDAALVTAKKRPLVTVNDENGSREIDYGFVGDVVSVDPTLPRDLIDRGYIPVICSLAVAEDGTILNVNADTIATEIAISLGAEKLVNMTSVEGVYTDFANREGLVSVLTVKDAQRLMDERVVAKGMRPKIMNLSRAVQNGVREAHIINGLTPHSLLIEIFTNEGIGTMVIEDEPVEVEHPS